MKAHPFKMSKIVIMHYTKLIFRSVLFLSALCVYIQNRLRGTGEVFGGFEKNSLILGAIWCVFFVEMLFKTIPFECGKYGVPEAVREKLYSKTRCRISGAAFIVENDACRGNQLAFVERTHRRGVSSGVD